jgi:ribosomal protein L37E
MVSGSSTLDDTRSTKMSENICPNCGTRGFDENKKDYECKKCGYHKIETKDEGEIELRFCEGCGCTLSTICGLHPVEKQKLVSL